MQCKDGSVAPHHTLAVQKQKLSTGMIFISSIHVCTLHTPWQWLLQDPSYDPYGFAKVATFAASSEGGSAAACPTNVQKFFSTMLSLGSSASGRKTINTDMSLCSDSTLASDDDAQNLALYVQNQWTTAVGLTVVTFDQCDLHHGIYKTSQLNW